ncbi:YceI family protein [Deinococcus sp.]|uniref:YceI family protein n=1 Tax=Deinococcus sp. TaxID=47478 RepID=UPI003C7B6ADF
MNWNIDPAHTTASFTVRHLAITNVRGSFSNVSGSITTDDAGRPTQITASIPVDTITTGQPDRDGHLKSPDFFNATDHSHITFEGGDVKDIGGGEYDIGGTLTMHGESRPVTLRTEVSAPVTDPMSGGRKIGAEATVQLSRKDFGLTWNVALEAGGVMVSDTVKVHLEIQAAQG